MATYKSRLRHLSQDGIRHLLSACWFLPNIVAPVVTFQRLPYRTREEYIR